MPSENVVSSHYTDGQLRQAIERGIIKLGKTTETISVADLGPVDEFHIGGRVATQHLLDQLDLQSNQHILDIGCGLGGGSRFAAQTYGCQVTGIDLTPEYVDTGNALSDWVGLGERIEMLVANATELPQANDSFDAAYMLHVGMNIADKQRLFTEIHRVVKSGAKIGIYDIMRASDGALKFPVPWATEASGSAVDAQAVYVSALESAGFRIVSVCDRREFALEFFNQMKIKASGSGPPPLGLHILMGKSAPQKIGNMIENISNGLIAPFEVIAESKR